MIIRIILIILIIQIENPDEECRSLLSDNVRWEKRLVCENKQDAIGYGRIIQRVKTYWEDKLISSRHNDT